ncbi:MAG: hypothetical protein AAGF47_06725 [Planctomycetota bacterium]
MNDRAWAIRISLIVVAALTAAAMLTAGVIKSVSGAAGGDLLLATGLLGVVIVLSAGAAMLTTSTSSQDETRDLERAMRDVERSVRHMGEQAALSDDARRVLNRTNERALLCHAIEEDIRVKDWEAADVLCNELSSRFGYHTDAERFRAQIESAKAEGLDLEVGRACAEVDQLITVRRWEDAARRSVEIEAAFPASPRAAVLRDRIRRARMQYKEELERRFLLAAQRDDIEDAMDLLRELDHYLSEHEAEPFREVARGVIGKARQNLGASFKLAYQDKQWGIAAGLGEQIVEQFPNTRMAAEVEALLPELRERADESREPQSRPV